jgi:hypothetical protein
MVLQITVLPQFGGLRGIMGNKTLKKKTLMDLIDERHIVILEIDRLLKHKRLMIPDEKRLMELLRYAGSLRQTIIEKMMSIDLNNTSEYEREYYRTLADYIDLVDGDREEEVFSAALNYAKRGNGLLHDNIDWINNQLEEIKKYRRVQTVLKLGQ